MRTMLVVMMALCLIAGTAIGKDLVKKDAPSRVLIDCTGAIPIACGETLSGDNTLAPNNYEEYGCGYSNETGGEIIYVLSLDDCYEVTATLTNMAADFDVFMGTCGEDADCIYYGDSTFTTDCLEPGDYYLVVDGYNGATGTFDLTVDCVACECPGPPPENDTCDGAIDLQAQGLQSFEIDLCLYNDDYSPSETFSGGCTGYYANGPDAVYMITLGAGETFSACVEPADGDPYGIDLSLYLITDCNDPINSCVAGDDSGNPECFDYTSVDGGVYYLIVDTFSNCGDGLATVTIGAPVANEDSTWGTVKSLYR